MNPEELKMPGKPSWRALQRTVCEARPNRPPDPPKVTASDVGDWCDGFLVRLYLSTVQIAGPDGKPSSRTEGNDSAVLAALCSIMREQGDGCFQATESAVAARASVAEETAHKALRRLAASKYIIRHAEIRGKPTRYSLVEESLDPLPPEAKRLSVTHITELASIAEGDLSDKAFRAKNIGKTAIRTYIYMAVYPDSTKAELARRSGRTKPTIDNACQRLRALGMADEEDGRWRVCTRRVRYDSDLPLAIREAVKIRSARKQARQEKADRDRERAEAEELFYALMWASHYSKETDAASRYDSVNPDSLA